jgi:DnaJ like chaperone protein
VQFWGKVVGVVGGLATRSPWLALAGLFLGHQFDRGFAERFRSTHSGAEFGGLQHLPEYFTRTLFQVMGFVAKSDGRVSEDEIRAARALMHRLGMGSAQIRNAIGWFDNGKVKTFPLLATMRQFRRESVRKPELRGLMVRFLMEVSLSKAALHQSERSILWVISKELGIGRVELAQLEAMLRAQRGFRKSPAGNADAARVSDAYRVLGVDRSSTNAEIKTAYRRLMNKNHPDKIAGSNPMPAEVAAAEKSTRDIRGAYEMLKARRTIR